MDRGVAAKSTDEAFRPVYVATAPDGSLHVADMYEHYIAHGQHYQNQIARDTGRIYRLAGKDSALEKDLDVASRSTARLLELLDHPNKWHRLAAVQVLGERRDPAAVPTLREKIASGSGHAPLQALWALHQAAGLDPATAVRALGHRDPAVRGWTARLLGDRHGVSRNPALPGTGGTPAPLAPALLEALVGQARVEPVAEVRAQLASTARRLAPAQALPILTALLTHPEDVDDPFLPLLCWWVLESQLPAEGDRLMVWLQDRALWSEPLFVRQILPRLARRWAAEGRRQDLLRVAQLLRQAPGPGEAGQVLQGFEEAYRGRPMTG
ncbi:MAG: HEAT repeat domain-containing protein, partial [Verrucomicrobiota bacterium]